LLLKKTNDYDDEDRAFSIDSIYTIKDGKAVPVLVSPFWLSKFAILAADGTFFRAESYHNAGCADLYSYRLDAGAAELTLLTEYHASLRFSEDPDTVPVPYWYKVVDGKNVEITEKEFNALEAKYRNPGEQMELTFLPIDVDAPAPTTTEEPTTTKIISQPIEYPACHKDAPKAYKPILDDLYRMDQIIRRDEPRDELDWRGDTYITEFVRSLGYAVVDINHDGIPELLLLTKESPYNPKEPFIHSLFTLKDDQPVNVGYYWGRHRGHLAADGTIYTRGSGGGSCTTLGSFKLKPGAAELTQLTEYESDYFPGDDTNNAGFPYFFKLVDGKNQYITEKEFWALCEKYENPAKPMKLNFIPIEQ